MERHPHKLQKVPDHLPPLLGCHGPHWLLAPPGDTVSPVLIHCPPPPWSPEFQAWRRPTHSFSPVLTTVRICLNCQEIFELVPLVKHLSNSYVTLLLPCLAPVCRCLIKPIEWMHRNITGPRNVASVWWFKHLSTHFMRYIVNLKYWNDWVSLGCS